MIKLESSPRCIIIKRIETIELIRKSLDKAKAISKLRSRKLNYHYIKR